MRKEKEMRNMNDKAKICKKEKKKESEGKDIKETETMKKSKKK